MMTHLPQPDIGQQCIAQALAADGICFLTALADVGGHRFGGTTPSDVAVVLVTLPQETEVTTSLPLLDTVCSSDSDPSSCSTLKGKPAGDAIGSVNTWQSPCFAICRTSPLDVISQAGFVAKSEGGAHLNSGSAFLQCGHKLVACSHRSRPARRGHSKRRKAFRSTSISFAVKRLAAFGQLQLASRWRVVAAGRRTLDDESVHAAIVPSVITYWPMWRMRQLPETLGDQVSLALHR